MASRLKWWRTRHLDELRRIIKDDPRIEEFLGLVEKVQILDAEVKLLPKTTGAEGSRRAMAYQRGQLFRQIEGLQSFILFILGESPEDPDAEDDIVVPF